MRRTVTIALAGTLAIAGCGSSSHKPSAQARVSGAIKFADCMRTHGVPNLPDPTGGGGGIQIPVGSSINPASPAFQQAQKRCKSLLPGGGPGGSQATAQQKLTMLHLSRCMRAHGVTGFPDPVSSPPASPVGYAMAFGSPGAFLAIPQSLNPQSPVFKHAATACHFPGT